MPQAGAPGGLRRATGPADGGPRQMLLSVWCPRPGEFAARAVLADGSVRDFGDPFELVRFLSRPVPPPVRPSAAPLTPAPGLR